MGKVKNILIEIINIKEYEKEIEIEEKEFYKRQKIKREHYIKKFNDEELKEYGRTQLQLF